MDIHKPKPWHGVREFLKEYVIIVVGVLTALGAEQVAEAVHTSHKAIEAEALVREEFTRNIAFAQEKGVISPCNQAKFQMVERLLLGVPADRPVPALKPLDLPGRPYVWREWEAAVASGIAGHFPADRRAIYERIYITSGVPGAGALSSVGSEQRGALARLQVLTLAPRKLDAATRENLLEQAVLASTDETFIVRNTRGMVALAEPLHLPLASVPTVLWTPEKAKACLDAIKAEADSLPPIPTAGG